MNKYIEYGKAFDAREDVLKWLTVNLSNYLKNNTEIQDEIEHIIDYLVSESRPVRINKMSYSEAKSNTEKWNKSLIKQGNKIIEVETDTELVKDFGDGFKIVKLIGKNAYDREGFLMRHCISSYYGGSTEIYSLRDQDNKPHCTMEKNKQIKGKGNGSISTKYIKYIVDFLKEVGMNVGDNEMKNLGYVNVEQVKNDFNFTELFNDKYFLSENLNKIEGRNNIKLWKYFKLFSFDANLKVKFNFDISLSIKSFKLDRSQLVGGDHDSQLSGGVRSHLIGRIRSQLSGGHGSQLVGGVRSQLAGDHDSELVGGHGSQLAGGYDSKLVGGDDSQLSGGDRSQLVGKDDSQLSGGVRSQLIGGVRSQLLGGVRSQLVGGVHSQLSGGVHSQLSGGEGCVIIAEHGSKIKSGINSIITFIEREGKKVNFKSVLVDGDQIKIDTWYTFKNGEIIEAF